MRSIAFVVLDEQMEGQSFPVMALWAWAVVARRGATAAAMMVRVPRRTARARANANRAILRALRSRCRRGAQPLPQRRRRARQRHPRTSRVSDQRLGSTRALQTEWRMVPMKAILRGRDRADLRRVSLRGGAMGLC